MCVAGYRSKSKFSDIFALFAIKITSVIQCCVLVFKMLIRR